MSLDTVCLYPLLGKKGRNKQTPPPPPPPENPQSKTITEGNMSFTVYSCAPLPPPPPLLINMIAYLTCAFIHTRGKSKKKTMEDDRNNNNNNNKQYRRQQQKAYPSPREAQNKNKTKTKQNKQTKKAKQDNHSWEPSIH